MSADYDNPQAMAQELFRMTDERDTPQLVDNIGYQMLRVSDSWCDFNAHLHAFVHRGFQP